MLKYFRENNIHVIGFSATPLRPVKNACKQLLDIYGIYNINNSANRLNIISNYFVCHLKSKTDDTTIILYYMRYYIHDNYKTFDELLKDGYYFPLFITLFIYFLNSFKWK